MLIELVKNKLRKEDKRVVSNIDFNQTDDEIIANMITVGLLKFDEDNYDN